MNNQERKEKKKKKRNERELLKKNERMRAEPMNQKEMKRGISISFQRDLRPSKQASNCSKTRRKEAVGG